MLMKLAAFRPRSVVFSLQFTRWINCRSCSITLQDANPKEPGYYVKPKISSQAKHTSLQDIRYLLFSQDLQIAKTAMGVAEQEELQAANNMSDMLMCKRCSDAIHQNRYDLKEFTAHPYKQVIDTIPTNGPILHLAPLPEFPFHLNSKLLTRESTFLVFSKSDQVLTSKSSLHKKLPIFFKDFLKYHVGIESNKTIGISSLKSWNITTLFSLLKEKTYLLGTTNAGKSTLINALIKKYMGYRVKLDMNGNIIPSSVPTKMSSKYIHLKTQSTGVSYIPNLTRQTAAFQIQNKIIFDMPGYTMDDDDSLVLDSIIRKDWLERIRKTELFKTEKLQKKRYTSIVGTSNGACYTVGGMFFIVPPPSTINQIVKYIPGEQYQLKNIDRGIEIFSSCHDNNHPLNKYCGVNQSVCDKAKYTRYLIPPFQGSIEIVFKNIGYILLRTVGKYNYRGLHEVWAPKGIDVCVREPLERHIEEGYYHHIESKGQIPACTRDRPIVSSVYPVPHDLETESMLDVMREVYIERTKHNISARRLLNKDPHDLVQTLHKEPLNLYWYYNWAV